MSNYGFRATTMMGFGAVISLFTIIMAVGAYEQRQIQLGVYEIETNVTPYELMADQMAFDVVQVQQYLTDVSATHDRDGFKDAATHAKSFKESVV